MMRKFAATPNGDNTAFITPVTRLVVKRSAALSNSGSGKINTQKSFPRGRKSEETVVDEAFVMLAMFFSVTVIKRF